LARALPSSRSSSKILFSIRACLGYGCYRRVRRTCAHGGPCSPVRAGLDERVPKRTGVSSKAQIGHTSRPQCSLPASWESRVWQPRRQRRPRCASAERGISAGCRKRKRPRPPSGAACLGGYGAARYGAGDARAVLCTLSSAALASHSAAHHPAHLIAPGVRPDVWALHAFSCMTVTRPRGIFAYPAIRACGSPGACALARRRARPRAARSPSRPSWARRTRCSTTRRCAQGRAPLCLSRASAGRGRRGSLAGGAPGRPRALIALQRAVVVAMGLVPDHTADPAGGGVPASCACAEAPRGAPALGVAAGRCGGRQGGAGSYYKALQWLSGCMWSVRQLKMWRMPGEPAPEGGGAPPPPPSRAASPAASDAGSGQGDGAARATGCAHSAGWGSAPARLPVRCPPGALCCGRWLLLARAKEATGG